jgi:hypothetical protein
VAHACNPSYSRGRDQEDNGSKLVQTNSSQDPISKIPNTKGANGVAQVVGPGFKPWYGREKKKKTLENNKIHKKGNEIRLCHLNCQGIIFM